MSERPLTITGLVRDTRGSPIKGARVYFVAGPAPFPDIAALTDSGGRFSLIPPSPGTYQLEVSFEGLAGFIQKTITVDVREEHGPTLEIQLET
jgi:hypothetical protein